MKIRLNKNKDLKIEKFIKVDFFGSEDSPCDPNCVPVCSPSCSPCFPFGKCNPKLFGED